MAKAKASATTTRSEVAIPKLAKQATRAAFNRAVKKDSVLVYGNGELRKVSSDGKITVVKKMATRSKVETGAKFALNAKTPRLKTSSTKPLVKGKIGASPRNTQPKAKS